MRLCELKKAIGDVSDVCEKHTSSGALYINMEEQVCRSKKEYPIAYKLDKTDDIIDTLTCIELNSGTEVKKHPPDRR